jgi:restriction system protein
MRTEAVTTAVQLGLGSGRCDTHTDRLDFRRNPVFGKGALGLDRIYVQAKRYGAARAVGRPEIHSSGALHGAQADRGIFITTSRFTPEAATYADRVAARVVLIDGQALSGLMVQHNVGVQDQHTYVIKRIDEDFFEES